MTHEDIVNKIKRITPIDQQLIENYYYQEIDDIYDFIKKNLESSMC